MSSESIIRHNTPVGGNLFSDLGFGPDEAARLLAETDALISKKLATKSALKTELEASIESRPLDPVRQQKG